LVEANEHEAIEYDRAKSFEAKASAD